MVFLSMGRQESVGQEPGQGKTSTFMRLKLEPAKAILEGLALEDYAMITKNAGTIRNLMLDEGWMIVQTEDYRRQSDEFRKAVEQLREAANQKNLDGATLAYVQMTIRCVQCHQSLRK
jgi:cytochrome c556